MRNELEVFREIWERESAKTLKLLESLPADGYDFRPDAEGRSLGELAWHIPEAEAYGTFGIERGGFSANERPAGIERPRTIPELSSGFTRVHAEAAARMEKLTPDDLDRSITFLGNTTNTIRNVLWGFVLLHGIHHRGQLTLMARQFGGQPSSVYGPTRETMPLRRPSA